MRPQRHATFHFHGELNDFLPPQRKFVEFSHSFELRPSVKDMVESLGVPHPEIDEIIVNGTAVDFSHSVENGDRIIVFPADSSRPDPARPLRPTLKQHHFVLDTHLGRLATYLRMLGFDSVYENYCDDDELARVSHDEQRILLTRDLGLLKRSEVVYGRFVRATAVKQQVSEVVRRYNLIDSIAPLSRCLRCNTLLVPIAKEHIQDRLQPRTRELFDEFRHCETCHRPFWRGSHYDHMISFIQSLSHRGEQ